MKDITDVDYNHIKSFPKDFKIQLNIMIYMFKVKLLADVFNICRNTCLKIYKVDPARFFSITGLAWQAALKRR